MRVPGEITPEKLAIVRHADDIWIKELRRSGQYEKVWQAYAALLPIKTVGVKGDERSYEAAISLRAVISEGRHDGRLGGASLRSAARSLQQDPQLRGRDQSSVLRHQHQAPS